jgi:hypothetical protein
MNTKPLFVYSRVAPLAGSRPRKEGADSNLVLSPFRARSKSAGRVLRQVVGKPEVIGRDLSGGLVRGVSENLQISPLKTAAAKYP